MNIKQEDLTAIIRVLDDTYDLGYARRHPELVGAMLLANAIHELDNTLSSTARTVLNIRG